MANKNQMDVDEETIGILKKGIIQDNVYYLPKIQLERNVYEKVNKVLLALGAKWNRKKKGHIFEYDISNMLQNVYKEKRVTNWKKQTEYFYTPKNVINIMFGTIPLYYNEQLEFLEPSCGKGHIADEITTLFPNSKVTCIEINPYHCEFMKQKGYNPICTDFLTVEPEEKYDVIIMNPPFKEQKEHIMHAYKFLKNNGYLVTVATSSVLQLSNKKGQEFKKWFQEKNGAWYKLPQNSFKEAGTNVNAILLIFEKIEPIKEKQNYNYVY